MTQARASILVLLLASVASVASPQLAPAQGQRSVQAASGEVSVVADRFEQIDSLLVATGNVEVTRGSGRLLADRVEINRATGDAVAIGRAIFYDGDDRLTGERIEFNINTGTGVVYQGEVHTAPYYRLKGERLERLGESVYRVRQGVFTTCEDEVPTWSFHLGDGTADLEEFVYGWHVSFWAKSIPIIPYFPFFAAAIRRERQTGFLPPVLGSSTKKGVFAEIPFFWAISDSQDATVTLAGYQRKGIGGAVEYRYIISRDQRGKLNGAFVNELFEDGDLRGFGSVKHDWQIAPGLSLRADLNAVSDDLVLRDYESSLQQRSVQRAESNLFLTKSWTNWSFTSRVYWYQDLTTDRPVELQRVPELTLGSIGQEVPGLPGFLYRVDTSFVNFFRYEGSEGARFDLHPVVARPIPLAGYATVTPFVGGRITAYSTTVTGVHAPVGGGLPAIEDTNGEPRVRELFEYGSDAESRVSRVYQLGGWGGLDRMLHSIEPRAHYIRIHGHNFYSLPLWTDQTDRIPEASWFEYSLTNRFRARTIGSEDAEMNRLELFKLVLAGAYDFEIGQLGNVAGDLTFRPSRVLWFHGDLSYNVTGDGLQAYTTDMNIEVPRLIATVGTRYNRMPQVIKPYFVQNAGTFNPGNGPPSNQAINFLQGAASVDILRNLKGRVKTNWNIQSTNLVETRFGLDFKFDCWALSLDYIRRAPDRPGKNPDNEFRFALNLLGLGGVLSTQVGAGATDSAPRFR
jgi:LPS-assembly protein